MDYSMDPAAPACGDGPVVFGVPWACPAPLMAAAARFARSVDAHLVCAYVDPAGYLAEWDPPRSRHAVSLDPAGNIEALFPATDVKEGLVLCLTCPGRNIPGHRGFLPRPRRFGGHVCRRRPRDFLRSFRYPASVFAAARRHN